MKENTNEWYALTPKQTDFLIYIRQFHYSMGWAGTVTNIINQGGYTQNQKEALTFVVNKFKALRDGYDVKAYNEPMKYLK